MKKLIDYRPPKECPTCGKPFADNETLLILIPHSEGKMLASVPQGLWLRAKIRRFELWSAGLIGLAIGKWGTFSFGYMWDYWYTSSWLMRFANTAAGVFGVVFLTSCAVFVGVVAWQIICSFASEYLRKISWRVRDPQHSEDSA